MDRIITENQVRALRVVVDTMRKDGIPYVVIGGLAAIAWGARRPLADIDIQLYHRDLGRIRLEFIDHIVSDITHYRTDTWDIDEMVLEIEHTTIDVCQSEDFYVIRHNKKVRIPNYIDQAEWREVAGVRIPVIPRQALIDYKKFIARQVDLEDVAMLEA
jgi:hypothetical protein